MSNVELQSFRIQNFRSIVDSDWRNLSSDHITVLIGQNESGKTTVLEALFSFYTGKIIEDVFRSDQRLPEVSCQFTLPQGENLLAHLDAERIPAELKEKIKKQKTFTLSRSWSKNHESSILYSGDEILNYYQKRVQEIEKAEKQTIQLLDSFFAQAEKEFAALPELEKLRDASLQQLIELQQQTKAQQLRVNKAQNEEEKKIASDALQQLTENQDQKNNEFIKQKSNFDTQKAAANALTERLVFFKKCKQHLFELEELDAQFSEIKTKLIELQQLLELSTNSRDKRHLKKQIQKIGLEEARADARLSNSKAQKHIHLVAAEKVLTNNTDISEAVKTSKLDYEQSTRLYNLNQLGEECMKLVPVFEFFEDFSGLLPNKIDLEDILHEREHTEGYKAVRNFLSLAGLSSSFFHEKNQRILKQGIEALNTDVTINFHDYWSQMVGKNNKIKLHLELEHYDYTMPEKSGKPYLEFWIKDKHERLYPKQRSRGVRWFLSFYLELKATEKQNSGNRILLIDEPGLSLHARAQEDVLKVFEDLKDKMQIIYCTHSPHLVKPEKLYRILAVQRLDQTDDHSETHILDPQMITKASADTLSPVYSIMGMRLGDSQLISNRNNILVPDIIHYYYLSRISKIISGADKLNFIPATSVESISLLVNILTSWQVPYGVLFFGNTPETLIEQLQSETLIHSDSVNHQKLLYFSTLDEVEDIFSTLDFKKYILLRREGITITNSAYIFENDLSRKILAANFVNSFEAEKNPADMFDQTTINNMNQVFDSIKILIKP